ncbi:hypothetical protein OO184_10780 [Photorhabdus sp. APURE]|uniref:hypothetical protein n=1 Tax=Photorhabdus aballayi TaxID=2991723 RepID=UPI00223E636F|nr:hypothetical protein [Photorhabdus aballayi]MCW7548412.1 hypothetical protein [Photorhabdus aballayi]
MTIIKHNISKNKKKVSIDDLKFIITQWSRYLDDEIELDFYDDGFRRKLVINDMPRNKMMFTVYAIDEDNESTIEQVIADDFNEAQLILEQTEIWIKKRCEIIP